MHDTIMTSGDLIIKVKYCAPLLLQITTANCQKITKVDNIATNGVVHVVDSVLTPVGDTLLNLVSKNPELSTLKTGRDRCRLQIK